ncbi:hypothetical protein QNM34_14520 [Rahnella bonaserana]|uniref:hypothetical protein n=1 Tax=Rahnella bonaserana TaxID=2816248 RepID=UPI0024C34F3D|nr:hypothetical protein [Rahnella bonaserana]WHZ39259.1 hypothetical protein QNM34_14520 [Rahnella bonaserana]
MIKKFSLKNLELPKLEQDEFRLLVAEVATQGFTNSGQVSQYIVRNKLGDRYQNISGFLEMKKADDVWDFKGGFPKHIFARLCQELNLVNNGSMARPGKFRSFKDSD